MQRRPKATIFTMSARLTAQRFGDIAPAIKLGVKTSYTGGTWMSGNGIDTDILKGVAGLGGLFAAAWLSDRIGFGGSKALFVGVWLVCGVIIYAVAVALLRNSSNTKRRE